MKALEAIHFPQKATYLQAIDLPQLLGNLVNIGLCELPRYGCSVNGLSTSTLGSMLGNTRKGRHEWFNYALSGDDGKPGSGLNTDVMLVKFFGDKDIVKVIDKVTRDFIGKLLLPPINVIDYGGCLKADLVNQGWLSRSAAVLPSTGWARDTLRSNLAMLDAWDAFVVPHPASDVVENLAHFLLRLDYFRIRYEMFEVKEMSGAKGKDKIFGFPVMLTELLDKIHSYFNLYRVYAMRLAYSVHSRLRAAAKAAYARRFGERNRDVILIAEKAEADFLSLPTHPLASYLTSVLSTGMIRGELGEHEAIWFYTPTSDIDFLYHSERPVYTTPTTEDRPKTPEEKAKEREQKRQKRMGERTDCRANDDLLAQFYERYLAGLAAATTRDSCATRHWGWDNAMATSSAARPAIINLPTLMAIVKGDPELEAGMRNQAAAIGHPSLSGSIGTIDYNGCDFALTDGFRVGRSPTGGPVTTDQVMLGLTPLLSLGNTKSFGISRRFVTEFKAIDQRVFTVPYKGVVDVIESKAFYERYRLPASMLMGEDDVQYVNAFSAEASMGGADKVASSIVTYYRGKASYYITQHYSDTQSAKLVSLKDYKETDWDPRTLVEPGPADVSAEANLKWQLAIRELNLAESSNPRGEQDNEGAILMRGLTYAIRSGGQGLFYGRGLVQIARQDEYFSLNALNYESSGENTVHHTMIFDNDLEVQSDLGELDKFLVLAPPFNAAASPGPTLDAVAKQVT